MKNKLKKAIKVFARLLSHVCYSRCGMTEQDAREVLENYSPKPKGTAIANNRMEEPICDLQIIIPAYNVENYLRDCLDSVLNQNTGYSYKVVLVDDGSKDLTPEICDEYIKDERIIVIHQENRGFSGARNRALETIFARYVMFLDSDDMLCEGAIEKLISYADLNGAEIVEGGMQRLVGTKLLSGYKYKQNGKFPSKTRGLKGFPWGKVYKAELFKNKKFPEGFWFEDTMITFCIFSETKNAYFISDCVYKYRDNPTGISNNHFTKPKSCDTYWVTEAILEDAAELGIQFDDELYNKFLWQLVINCKRLRRASSQIQKSVFILSNVLMNEYFKDKTPPKEYKVLCRAVNKRNYLSYILYCMSR